MVIKNKIIANKFLLFVILIIILLFVMNILFVKLFLYKNSVTENENEFISFVEENDGDVNYLFVSDYHLTHSIKPDYFNN